MWGIMNGGRSRRGFFAPEQNTPHVRTNGRDSRPDEDIFIKLFHQVINYDTM
jgi:hypothetical protein